MQYFQIDIPPFLTDEHYDLTASIISKSKQEFLRQFGNNSRFLVILYPRTPSFRIAPFLQAHGVEYFDFSDSLDLAAPQFQIQGDGHPNPLAHELLAQQLALRMTQQPPGI